MDCYLIKSKKIFWVAKLFFRISQRLGKTQMLIRDFGNLNILEGKVIHISYMSVYSFLIAMIPSKNSTSAVLHFFVSLQPKVLQDGFLFNYCYYCYFLYWLFSCFYFSVTVQKLGGENFKAIWPSWGRRCHLLFPYVPTL